MRCPLRLPACAIIVLSDNISMETMKRRKRDIPAVINCNYYRDDRNRHSGQIVHVRLGIGYFSIKRRLYLRAFSRRNISELTFDINSRINSRISSDSSHGWHIRALQRKANDFNEYSRHTRAIILSARIARHSCGTKIRLKLEGKFRQSPLRVYLRDWNARNEFISYPASRIFLRLRIF